MKDEAIDLEGPVLSRKTCIPPLRHDWIARPHLIEKLDGVRLRRAALLRAPAGFGKTVLAASWAARQKSPLAWISLDDGDVDLSRLARHLVAAIRQADAAFADVAHYEGRLPSLGRFADDLLVDIERANKPLLVVLDDGHSVEDSASVCGFLAKLVALAPRALQWIVCSRTPLESVFAKPRIEQDVIDIGKDDLRFSEQETRAFLTRSLDAAETCDFARIHSYAKGWPAALLFLREALAVDEGLCAALSSRSDGVIDGIDAVATKKSRISASSAEAFFGYASEQVLGGRSETARTIALASACIEPVSAEMLEQVVQLPTSVVVESLETFAREGLIECVRDDAGAFDYRLSGIFRDVCLHAVSEQEWRTWSKSAAAWCELHGQFDRAVMFAARIGDYDRIERIAWSRFPVLFRSSDFALLDSWVSLLPDEELASKPRLALMRALPAAQRRSFDSMDVAIEQVRRTLKRERKDRYFGFANIISACAKATSAHRDEARILAHDALEALSQDDVYLRGIALQIIAESYLEADASAMREQLYVAFDAGEWRLDPYYAHSLLSTLTMVNAMLGCFRAQAELDRALNRYGAAVRPRDPTFVRMHIGRAGMNYHEGAPAEARVIACIIHDEVVENGIEIDTAYLLGLESMIAFKSGDRTEAACLFTSGLEESALFVSFSYPSYALIRSIYPFGSRIPRQLADPDPQLDQPALLRLKLLVALSATGKLPLGSLHDHLAGIPETRPMERFQWLLLCAIDAETRGKTAAADGFMRRALACAEAEGYVEAVRDESPFLLKTLKRVVDRESLFQTSLLRSMPIVDRSSARFDALTPREREVASFLESELSYAEIAERLFVAEETVRKHVKRVFAKLGVHSRAQAASVLHSSKLPDCNAKP